MSQAMDEEHIQKLLTPLVNRIEGFAIWLLYGMGILLALATAFEGPHVYSAWGYSRGPFEFTTAGNCFRAA
jgi:hypothetical protein